MEDRIVRKKKVEDLTDLSSSQIDRMEKSNEFPKRRQITERIVGWSYVEIQAWIHSRLHVDAEAKQALEKAKQYESNQAR
jgi:predicted DNA-binding transcriptional regulator AlpA